jgi:uncharacterized repeat protein (TIGR03943 family)
VSPFNASSTVLATGLLALWMGLTDAMLKYLKPSMRPWLVLAGALLVAVGIRGLVRARQRELERERVGAAGDNDGHGGHSHDPGEHTHHQGVGWLLVVPVLIVLALGQQSLGAFAAAHSTTRNLPPYSFDIAGYANEQGDGTPTLQLVDVYLGAQQHGNRGYLASHPVHLRGFVTKLNEVGPRSFVLTRFLVSCCAADATPVNIAMIDADHVPKVGKWVDVTAQLDPHYASPAGTATSDAIRTTMRVHAIKPTDEPSEPYEALR